MKKVVFLVVLTTIPAILILFLHAFGENKFTIPVYYEDAASMNSDLCTFDEGQHYIPAFELESTAGPISEGWLQEGITVVDFFFTSCPTICPEMSNQLSRVQNHFSDNPNVRLLSVTIDPEYDSLEVLQQYANRYNAVPEKWAFARTQKDITYDLIRCGFLLGVQDGNGIPADYSHSDRVVLVDSQGRIRGYYSGTDREEVDRLITEMRILLEEEELD